MTVAFYTLGCKLNQSETESIAASFEHHGFHVLSHNEKADLYIINTCTVTSKSDQKARRMIRYINQKYPQSFIVITGCYAEVEQEKLKQEFETDCRMLIIPQSKKSILMEMPDVITAHTDFIGLAQQEKYTLLHDVSKLLEEKNTDVFRLNNADFFFHSRAFVKIQDGCDGRCTYCRVPAARGKAQSLDAEKVIQRVRHLEAQGFREIVLTGVNITAYQYNDIDFNKLLQMLLQNTTKLRFRVSSLEPEKITPQLAKTLSEQQICAHFHIPVQSGSDTILNKMRRRYSIRKVKDGIDLLKKAKPHAFFAADIIVGFPGESEKDFMLTKELVTKLDFAKLHVFPYSLRPGTEAAGFKGRIQEDIVKNRVQELLQFSNMQKRKFLKQYKNREIEVVLEKEEQGCWIGTSGESIRCAVENVLSHEAGKRTIVKAIVLGTEEPCRSKYI